MRCEGCNQEKDDVVIVDFQWVISIIFMSFRNPVIGAYCRRCRTIRGVGLSLVTATVGWWGFPWGLIYTPIAIVKNISHIFKKGAAASVLTARVAHRPRSSTNDHDHYAVELRGQYGLPAGVETWFRHTLIDVTHPADPRPVIGLLDWQQASDSRIFVDVTPLGRPERGQFLDMDDWVDLNLPIIPEAIQAPHAGHRELLSVVELMHAPDTVVWRSEVPFSLQLPLPGYVEANDRERADDGLIVRMAIAVAAAAGDISNAEINVVREWSKTRLALQDPGDQDTIARQDELAGALQRSIADADAGTLNLEATLTRFRNEGSESGRIEAVELCLAVMGVDGRADREEMKVINRVASVLEIDEAWFAENRDKSVSGLSTHIESASDFATLLGIDPTADRDTIKRQLNEQYDRWNSRAATLEDPEKRREAEQMLETIAKARQELLG
jgi:uncharacterized tellurite resistance protein B-like protein